MLKYCTPVWMSVAASHLDLLDCVVSKAVVKGCVQFFTPSTEDIIFIER